MSMRLGSVPAAVTMVGEGIFIIPFKHNVLNAWKYGILSSKIKDFFF